MEPQGTQRKTLCPQEKRSKGTEIAGWEIDSLVEGEAVVGGEGLLPTRAQREGSDDSLHFLKLPNFSVFSVVIF